MTTEQLHTIKIDGLPDGWQAVEARIDTMSNVSYMGDDGNQYIIAKLKLEKIQPRRIVLEETGEDNMKLDNGELATQFISLPSSPKIWQVVEEE